MTAEQFLDKLDKFIMDTVGKEFEYRYEIEYSDEKMEKQGVWFEGFYILGFEADEDE